MSPTGGCSVRFQDRTVLDDTTIYLEFSFPPEIPDLKTALDLLSSCAGDLLIVRDRSISTEKARFDLHWLPVAERIDYKILLLTFDCLYGTAPEHLTGVIRRYVPRRAGLRSFDPDSAVTLEISTWRRDTLGGRAFSN